MQEHTGPRHVLGGRAVHPGAALEVRMDGPRWVRGTYQWSFDPDDDPCLVVDELWGPHVLRLDADDLLRWP